MPVNASTFVQGLYVMGVGMGVVFAALILVMLAIMALDRLFKVKQAPAAAVAKAAITPPAPAAQSALSDADQELVAAISIALALKLQSTGKPPSPVHVISLENESSVWAAVGRL